MKRRARPAAATAVPPPLRLPPLVQVARLCRSDRAHVYATPAELAVAVVLADAMNREGRCFLSRPTIAARARYGLTATDAAIHGLCSGPRPVFKRRLLPATSRRRAVYEYELVRSSAAFAEARDQARATLARRSVRQDATDPLATREVRQDEADPSATRSVRQGGVTAADPFAAREGAPSPDGGGPLRHADGKTPQGSNPKEEPAPAPLAAGGSHGAEQPNADAAIPRNNWAAYHEGLAELRRLAPRDPHLGRQPRDNPRRDEAH